MERQRPALLFICLLYVLLLRSYFVETLGPLYEYHGFGVREVPMWVLWPGVCCVLLLSMLLPVRLTRPSALVSWGIYFYLVAPASFALPAFWLQSWDRALLTEAALFLAFACFELTRRGIPLHIPYCPTASPAVFLIGLPIAAAVIAVLLAFYTGHLNLLWSIGSAEAYDRRFAARDALQGGSFVTYLHASLMSVGLPCLAVVAYLKRRSVFLWSALTFATLYTYSVDGAKATLFWTGFSVLTCWAVEKRKQWGTVWLAVALTVMVGLSMSENMLIKSDVAGGLLINRTMIVPAEGATYWVDFWSTNPHVFFRDTALYRVATSNPGEKPARTIGAVYFHEPEENVNTGIWSSAYAEAGICFVFLTSLLAGLVLRVLDGAALATRSECRFLLACALSSTIAVSWVNVALHSSMLSNGVFLSIVCIAVFPSVIPEEGPSRLHLYLPVRRLTTLGRRTQRAFVPTVRG